MLAWIGPLSVFLTVASTHSISKAGLRPLDCWEYGFESSWGHACLSLVVFLCCTDRGLCDWPILSPGSPTECVCVWSNVISCNINPLHLWWIGTKCYTKKNFFAACHCPYCVYTLIPFMSTSVLQSVRGWTNNSTPGVKREGGKGETK